MENHAPFPFRVKAPLRPIQPPALKIEGEGECRLGLVVTFGGALAALVMLFMLLSCAGERHSTSSIQVQVSIPDPILPEAVPQQEPAPQAAPPALMPKPVPPPRIWRAPRWAIKGILAKESSSILRDDNTVLYVDRRRSLSGARGPTQVKRIAFDQVKKPGEAYWKVEVDTTFALEITERYLL